MADFLLLAPVSNGDSRLLLFFQILLANVVLLFVLITVHEFGHWFFGRIVGIPFGEMRIRLFSFPQQVQLRDANGWVSVSEFDRYFNRLREFVPSRAGQFGYVVGGFVFETIFLVILCIFLIWQDYWIYSIVAPGVSLLMYVVYVFAMDIPQSKELKRPWGDTTILFSLSSRSALLTVLMMVLIRIALILVPLISLF